MTWDAADGYGVLLDETGATWIYVGGTWTSLSTSPSPPARLEAAMTYDAADGYVLLFGGESGPSILGDTWKFSQGTWTNLTGRLSISPPPATDAGMAYDAVDGYVVLYGGYEVYNAPWTSTWTYRAGTWSLLPPSKVIPTPNADVELAYDAADGYVIFFGFWNTTSGISATTWIFQSGSWSALNLSYAPSPRQDEDLTYVSSLHAVVMVYGRPTDALGRSDLNETWLFSSGAWRDATNLSSGTFPSTMPGMEGPLADDPVDGYAFLSDPGCPDRICGQTFGFPAWPLQVVVGAGKGVVGLHELIPVGGAKTNGTFASGTSAWFFGGRAVAVLPAPAPGWRLDSLAVSGAAVLVPGGLNLGGGAVLLVNFTLAPMVQFLVRPQSCGPILFNGTPEGWLGYSLTSWGPGVYNATIGACKAHHFAWWSTGAGVTVASNLSNSTQVTVATNGTLLAVFEGDPRVTVAVAPMGCGPVTFNGSVVPTPIGPPGQPTPVIVPMGVYLASVPLCPGYVFQGWSVTGSLVLLESAGLNATIEVSGNGTLAANFAPTPPPPGFLPPTWPFLLFLIVGIVSIVLLAVATVLVRRRRRTPRRREPDTEPVAPPGMPQGPAGPGPAPDVHLW